MLTKEERTGDESCGWVSFDGGTEWRLVYTRQSSSHTLLPQSKRCGRYSRSSENQKPRVSDSFSPKMKPTKGEVAQNYGTSVLALASNPAGHNNTNASGLRRELEDEQAPRPRRAALRRRHQRHVHLRRGLARELPTRTGHDDLRVGERLRGALGRGEPVLSAGAGRKQTPA